MTVWKDRLFLETNLKPITMETKHTKEYAEKLAEQLIKGTEVAKLMRMSFANGYMEAIKESASPELLYALIEAKIQINYLHEKFAETGSGNKVLRLIESAINKATL